MATWDEMPHYEGVVKKEPAQKVAGQMLFTNIFTINIYFADTLLEKNSLHFLTVISRF